MLGAPITRSLCSSEGPVRFFSRNTREKPLYKRISAGIINLKRE